MHTSIAVNAIAVKRMATRKIAASAYLFRRAATDDPLMVTKRDIGLAIDRLRQGRGWSKKYLSQQANIEQGNLNRIISGKQEATLEKLQALAKVFRVHVSDIIRMAETGQKEDPRKTALIRLIEQLPAADHDAVFRQTSDDPEKPALPDSRPKIANNH